MKMCKVRCLLTVALKFVTWGWFSPLICFHIFGRVEPVTLPLASFHHFEQLQFIKVSISMHLTMWLFCEHIYEIFMENYTTLNFLILKMLCQIDLSKQPKIQNHWKRGEKALQTNIFLKIITNECFHGIFSLIFKRTIKIIDTGHIFPF